MKAKIVKIKPFTSYHGGKCFLLCFKGSDGKIYKTYVYPKMRNYKKWKPIMREGVTLIGLRIIRGKLIDADSPIKKVR